MNALSHRFQNTNLDLQNQPAIDTARLRLRVPTEQDIPHVRDCLNRFDVARMLIAVPQPFDLNDAKAIVDRWSKPGTVGWGYAVTTRDGGSDAFVGLIWIVWRNDSWRLAFWSAPQFWGKGLMSEAADALIQRFFRLNMAATLCAGAIADNTASLKLQEKLGFAVVGTSETYCIARNAMVTIIETELTLGSYLPL